jgi:signal peptide peptidase SppA
MSFIDTINDLWNNLGLPGSRNAPPSVAVLRLRGAIGMNSVGRGTLSLANLESTIKRAFSHNVRAVCLVINSPGGSPVQSAQIAGMIRQYSQDKKIPVFAFAEDIAASGGYWLALAADEIYADAMSVIGSIGVISASFGFQELLSKLGVERRVHARGERKGMLDPFQPEAPEDVERLAAIQADIHRQFINFVKLRRGERLSKDDAMLFNGDIWTGERALELGLVDGLGDVRTIVRRKYGPDVRFRNIDRPASWVQRRLGRFLPSDVGSAEQVGVWAGDLIAAVEERALWARFGL